VPWPTHSVVSTIVHFDGTSTLSLHTRLVNLGRALYTLIIVIKGVF